MIHRHYEFALPEPLTVQELIHDYLGHDDFVTHMGHNGILYVFNDEVDAAVTFNAQYCIFIKEKA